MRPIVYENGAACCGPAMERGEDGALHVFDCEHLWTRLPGEERAACPGDECPYWREHYASHGVTGEVVESA